MIEEHFPQVTGRVDAWNALATRVANALDMLRKLIEDAVRVRLTDPRYDKDELTRRIIEFVSNRAMRRQLGLPLDQPPGQGHVWFHRALIAMEIQGHRVIELGNIPDDEYEETRENLMGLVDDLIEDAQRSKWAIEVQDANQALMSDSAGSDLLEAIHAEQIRERIFVAAGCPACGVVPRGS
jgi:hypothetical protein